MKYFPLVWATLWRKKTRTVLTLLSIVVAFLLYGMLETVDYALGHPSSPTGADKLVTTNKYSITFSLPMSAMQQIASIPGVAAVTHFTWFGGYYQESKNFVFAVPVDIDSYLDLHLNEFKLDPAQVQAFKNMRTGAIISEDLANKFHWKVGDKVPLHSTIWTRKDTGSLDWTFDIVGTFSAKDPTQRSQLAQVLIFHYEYFDEGRSFGQGTVGWYQERIKDPRQAADIGKKIDALFANSSNETKTSPASDFAMSFIKQQGDIAFILRGIIGAVFFTLLFLTGNTMMQSVRERIPELAVLKTLGFADGTVLTLVIAEALTMCLLAAIVGLLLAYAALPVLRMGLQGVQLNPVALLPGLAFATVLALIVGLPPALRAMRLDIVDALAGHR